MSNQTPYSMGEEAITSEESHKLGQQMNQAIHIQLEARLVQTHLNML